MHGAPRIVAAALLGCAVAALVATLASGAGGGTAALVELQVAPRGPGQVSASPAGVDLDEDNDPVTQPCGQDEDETQGEGDCRWGYDRGKTVTLTAKADSGKTFSGWSTPDCPGTGPCTVMLNEDLTSVVAIFSPLKLGVIYSSNSGTVTSAPAGSSCQLGQADVCFQFPPHTSVRLSATAKSGHTFKRWNPGCEPTNSPSCTIAVEDQPTWAGAIFDNDGPPQLPTTISVQFQLSKSGNGSGRITASKLDCGQQCSAKYDYGQTITLTATPDTGSVFDGWNGVCSRAQTTCRFPVGPITSIRAQFAGDTSAPSPPGDLTVRSATRTNIAIAWTASTDNVGVTGYRVYLNDATAGDTAATEFTFGEMKCGRKYSVAVDAVDAAGNRSPKATLAVETKPCALAARVVRVGVDHARGNRAVVVKLRINRTTTARLKLTRGGRTVASGRFRVKPGTNTLRLRVPRRLPGGPYRLIITLINPDGGALVLPSRGALLPQSR